MATYKVIQDIEAEDKLVGPLTPRQCLFFAGAAICTWLSFLSYVNGVPFFLIITVPPALFLAFFAFPFGRDQPTEIWALARIRFLVIPRKRIWNQTGAKELVTVTVPKHIERVFTDGLSQQEVRSRLSALANTIDSRGWAVKNVNVNLFSQSDGYFQAPSDRLIDASSLPREVPNYEVSASDDILDENNNPVAQKMGTMIAQSTQAHRQQLMARLNAPQHSTHVTNEQPPRQWYIDPQQQISSMTKAEPYAGLVPDPESAIDEALLTAQLKASKAKDFQTETYSHLRTINPIDSSKVSEQEPAIQEKPIPQPPVTPQKDAVILNLSKDNDKTIATLGREAERAKQAEIPPEQEVVISIR